MGRIKRKIKAMNDASASSSATPTNTTTPAKSTSKARSRKRGADAADDDTPSKRAKKIPTKKRAEWDDADDDGDDDEEDLEAPFATPEVRIKKEKREVDSDEELDFAEQLARYAGGGGE